MAGTRALRRRVLVALGLVALVTAATIGATTALNVNKQVRQANAPDLILYNGLITTLDAKGSTMKAVAIRDGKIIAIGDQNGRIKALADDGTQVIDLDGRRVLPGLIDGTLHGIRTGYHCFTRSVRHETTFKRADALAEYARVAANVEPGKWLFTTSGSWNVAQLDVPGMFTKAELDAVAPNHPVFVQGVGFSGVQVNTAGLNRLGLSAGMPGVVVGPDGQPTGQLTAPANGAASRSIGAELGELTTDEQAACLEDFLQEINRRGLTAWDDPGGNDPFDPNGTGITVLRDQHGYQAVNLLHREGRLTARITFNLSCFGPDAVIGVECVKRHTFNATSRLGDDMLRLGGIGEDVLQVGPGGVYPEEDYHEILVHLAENDWKFQHHATAESTQHSMVDMWEMVNEEDAQMDDLGWVMLHPGEGPEDPSQEVLDQLAGLGAGIVPTNPGARGGGSSHPPYKRIYDSDARSCLGTDALNASTYAPFVNLWYTVSGKTYVPGVQGVVPEQRLTRTEALRMATEKCGWFLELDGKVGTLEPGKYADLIVLSDDYFKVPVDDIRTLTSVLTVVNGEIVWSDEEYAGL
ncbi:MAG TPA: amidohydrolase family protein [Gaiellaceae bacterium]|nr:amidohydrolase family protein [Gaiellaceae bacterium]